MSSPALVIELNRLAGDERPEVRISALAGLAAAGDEAARRGLAEEVRAGAGSTDPAVRLRAARALEVLDPDDRAAAAALLEDEDAGVRNAALDSVGDGDAFALAPALAALEEPRLVEAAAAAVGRLGDAVLPSLAMALDTARPRAGPLARRLVRSATGRSAARDEVLRRHAGHPDRELGLVVLERLVASEPAPVETALALEAVVLGDVGHAARIVAALTAIDGTGDDSSDADAPLRRALSDELELIRQRVRTALLARHGSVRIGPAMVELSAGGSSGALAMEALGVLLTPAEAKLALPLLDPGLSFAAQLERLPAPPPGPARGDPSDAGAWLHDVVEDPDGQWRSAWLCACAIHTAKARGVLAQFDVDAVRALGDPIIDEVLDAP